MPKAVVVYLGRDIIPRRPLLRRIMRELKQEMDVEEDVEPRLRARKSKHPEEDG